MNLTIEMTLANCYNLLKIKSCVVNLHPFVLEFNYNFGSLFSPAS